jgi:predicted AlkP superfamily phosphohydrolase/phosphomutase
MRKSILLILLAALAAGTVALGAEGQRALTVISIDGMHPENVLKADEHGLRIPNLRRLLRDGVHASEVRGVLPTVTYPSHTTMVTGVWPAKHGIYANETWDPFRKNQSGWYWYAEDIRAATLWEAASRAGYIVGSVSWPVSVGAKGIQFNIPEYWRAQTPDDLKLLRVISTPGLVEELEKTVGPYTVDLNAVEEGDWARTRYAIALLQKKQVRFLTLHLAAFDHIEHSDGPFSPRAFRALEELDRMVGEMESAVRAVDPQGALCVVSDHGFATVDHQLNLSAAFVDAGLITLKPGSTAVLDWQAAPWVDGGSAAILLKNPQDEALRAKVEDLLHRLARDPKNGIEQILDQKAIAALGGAPVAAFWVDMKPNFAVGSALTGPVVRAISPRGTHGFAPTHPELQASFLLLSPDVRKGYDLGTIDMRSIAPTLAHVMNIPFPGAELKPLPVLREDAR